MTYDYGARSSLRELFSDVGAMNHADRTEAAKTLRHLQAGILTLTKAFLAEHNVDIGDFAEPSQIAVDLPGPSWPGAAAQRSTTRPLNPRQPRKRGTPVPDQPVEAVEAGVSVGAGTLGETSMEAGGVLASGLTEGIASVMVFQEVSASQAQKWSAGERLVAEHLQVPVLVGRIYLLPDKTADGVAAYREDIAGLVKTLRRDGVDIEFALPKDARVYRSEYSADSVIASIAIAVAIGASSEAVVAAAKAIASTARARVRSVLGRSDNEADADSALVTVKIAELEIGQDKVVLRGVELTGRTSQIERLTSEALGRLVAPPTELEEGSVPQTDAE
ncbi:hypothetical protein [Streptomyces mirabilis]|uniref:hypothetical protein n=1 Tax=Streptomyces mirabilis TaxID=68239 RepID=UPI003420E25B